MNYFNGINLLYVFQRQLRGLSIVLGQQQVYIETTVSQRKSL